MNLTTREFLDRKYHFVQIIKIRETMKVSEKPESIKPTSTPTKDFPGDH